MLFLALIGAFAFVIGYELGVGRATRARTPRAGRPMDEQLAATLAVVVGALAVTSFLAFLATGAPWTPSKRRKPTVRMP
jgi:hypothetical protein